MQDLPRGKNWPTGFFHPSDRESGRSRLVSASVDPRPVQSRLAWHTFFAETLRFVLAPLILLSSGFFTANFLFSGQYTWPRTSRTLILTITILVLSYEFIYKEQLARSGSADQARSSVIRSCIIPYVVGVLLMVALARL